MALPQPTSSTAPGMALPVQDCAGLAWWTYLTGISFGLATIIEVLRFQSTRIRELASSHGHQH